MLGIEIRQYESGREHILVIDAMDENGQVTEGREIDIDAPAAYGELMGYSDPVDALKAIIFMQDHPYRDPGVDPDTGANVWTEAYALLGLREQAREEEAAKARDEGCSESEILDRCNRAA